MGWKDKGLKKSEMKGRRNFIGDMQSLIARYFYFRKIDMFSLRSNPIWYKSRRVSDISSASAHIESFMTYRKSRQRFISMKKDIFRNRKMPFFLWSIRDTSASRLTCLPTQSLRDSVPVCAPFC